MQERTLWLWLDLARFTSSGLRGPDLCLTSNLRPILMVSFRHHLFGAVPLFNVNPSPLAIVLKIVGSSTTIASSLPHRAPYSFKHSP